MIQFFRGRTSRARALTMRPSTARLAGSHALVVRRSAWLALSTVGAVVLVLLLINSDQRGSDAVSYWQIDLEHPYRDAIANLTAPIAFRYAPPLALLAGPFGALPWPVFLWLWTAIALVALAFVTRRWFFAAIALYPVALELSVLNVHLLLAASLLAGLRWPAAWAFLALTKVTPGVCWIWFAARREWRSLGVTIGVTVALSVISWIFAPHLWPEWVAMLQSNIGVQAGISLPVPLFVRLPLAVGIIAWGALTDRPWTLAVGLFLSIPTIWPQSFSVLVVIPLMARPRSARLPLANQVGRAQ